jgi:dihydroorotase
MLESILLKDIEIITPTDSYQGDMLVKNGKIVAIEPSINASAECVINEKGLTVIPGVIDPHVHFRDPGATHKEDIASGSHAAASGGVTTFFDMPNTNPATVTREAMAQKKAHAATQSLVNYNFYI